MKKIICLILTMVAALALVGCGGSTGGGSIAENNYTVETVENLKAQADDSVEVSFRIPFTSSLHSCASCVSSHLVFPAHLVGIVKRGITKTPTVAKIQFSLNMIIIATTKVIEFDKIEVKVLVTTLSTPEISLVIRVIISP